MTLDFILRLDRWPTNKMTALNCKKKVSQKLLWGVKKGQRIWFFWLDLLKQKEIFSCSKLAKLICIKQFSWLITLMLSKWPLTQCHSWNKKRGVNMKVWHHSNEPLIDSKDIPWNASSSSIESIFKAFWEERRCVWKMKTTGKCLEN